MTQAAEQAASAAQASGLSHMQQELLNRADAIFGAIGSAVAQASDAAMTAGAAVAKEIPDIAFQYIAFGRAYYTMWVVLGIVGIVMCYQWFLRVGLSNSKNIEDVDYNWAAARTAYTIAGAASGVVGILCFVINIKDTVLVWAAPKVWLLLELTELVRRVRG